MMRFMSKQVTSILKQRPEIFKAGFQGVNKIDVQESQDTFLFEIRERLIKIPGIKIAYVDITIRGDILLYLRQCPAKSAFRICLNFMLAHKNVSLVHIGWLRQPGKRIKYL